MPDKKISALTSLAQGDVAASTDVLPIVDTSATETKKITASALVGAGMTAGVTNVDINSGSIDGTTIGANSAAAGTFTNLTASGTVSFSGATVSNGGAVTTIDINGGTIDATSIGASSASTGAFTTLTTSSTVTLNGGTANGVLYLNGSKVATSGSALTFDGTNFATTGRVTANDFLATGSAYYATVSGVTYGSLIATGGAGALTLNANNGSNLIFQVASTEGFRLTSTSLYTASGINVGIGTSSPANKFVVSNAGAAGLEIAPTGTASNPSILSYNRSTSAYGQLTFASDFLVFMTNGTNERARITSGGYSKFSNDGTYVSSTGAYHEFRNTDAAQPILYLTATSGSYTGQTIYINNTRAASSAYKFYSANANAVEQFYVRGDGVLYAQNTTIQSLSDGRLKENVRNATEGLDVVNALRPVRYDWKAGYGNDRKDQLGFIAQEVEAVFPDAVSEWSKAEGDDEPYKTVGPGALIPVLVKAIQELTARVAALESK